MAEKTKSINLLPQKGEGFLDVFLGWALTVGRLLIILTETLALSVFLYRFSLDMKIVDLHDQIKNKSSIVAAFKNTEATVRDLQTRLAFAQKLDEASSMTPNALSDIVDMGRGKVTFRKILFSADSVEIDVQATNSSALSAFVNSLKAYRGITSVSINNVENKTTSAFIRMSISAKLNTLNK